LVTNVITVFSAPPRTVAVPPRDTMPYSQGRGLT
jgi:hypothetical protein